MGLVRRAARLAVAATFVTAVGAGVAARGETGIEALLEPWSAQRSVDGEGAARFFAAGKEEKDGTDLTLTQVTSDGRYRLSQDLPINPTLSWDATWFRLGGGPPRLPNQVADVSAGLASPIFGDEKLFLAGSVAAGYAGEDPFVTGRGWYGKADVLVGHQFDDTRTLMFFLDYDGNRTLLPDVPIPAVEYVDESNPNFVFALGFPVSLVDWKPTNKVDILIRVDAPEAYEVEADYEFVHGWTLYALAENADYRFATEDIPGNKRLLLTQNLVEAGLSWRPSPFAEFTVAGGYAFSQKFGQGFDERDFSRTIDLSDRPYVRFGIELSY